MVKMIAYNLNFEVLDLNLVKSRFSSAIVCCDVCMVHMRADQKHNKVKKHAEHVLC